MVQFFWIRVYMHAKTFCSNSLRHIIQASADHLHILSGNSTKVWYQ